jgi:hypothetical protein
MPPKPKRFRSHVSLAHRFKWTGALLFFIAMALVGGAKLYRGISNGIMPDFHRYGGGIYSVRTEPLGFYASFGVWLIFTVFCILCVYASVREATKK